MTQTTATTEELARASSSIAQTADEVAAQATETRHNLEQAEADVLASGERTIALAAKIRDIGGILDLINDIADQTDLLAVNAAIEAARAGEDGLGFASWPTRSGASPSARRSRPPTSPRRGSVTARSDRPCWPADHPNSASACRPGSSPARRPGVSG